MLTKLAEILSEFGLREEETKFYLASLELGKTTIAQVSQKISIPRSTCYLLLDSLKKKGLIVESPIGRKRTIIAIGPADLIKVLERREESLSRARNQLSRLLPELALITSSLADKPKVRFYEGKEGIKTVYEETFGFPEILVHCTTQTAIPLMSDYLNNYFTKVIKKGIKTREIVSDSPADVEYQKKYSTPGNIIRTIPSKYAANTDFMIYGDRVAWLSYRGGRPIGIVVEDKEIADLERKKFTVLWLAIEKKILF